MEAQKKITKTKQKDNIKNENHKKAEQIKPKNNIWNLFCTQIRNTFSHISPILRFLNYKMIHQSLVKSFQKKKFVDIQDILPSILIKFF